MSTQIQPVKDHDGYVRDTSTGAILATDSRGLKQYKLKRKRDKTLLDDINNLKKEMSEIKSLLVKIVDK